jgi:AcrR family transcriptional regulator
MPIVVDHDERREFIADVVKKLIAERGMKYVTIRNVAREAGFKSTLISHYFEDKKAMLAFTLETIWKRAGARVSKAIEENKDLASCLDSLLPIGQSSLSDWQAWFGFWGMATYDPDLAAVRLRTVEATHETLKRMLKAAQNRNELPPDLDLEFHARRLQTVLNGIAAMVVIDPSSWPKNRQRSVFKTELELMNEMPHLNGASA